MEMTPKQQELSAQLTNLQRLTVLGVVEGKSQRQAYYDAGGTAKTDETADASVSRMLSDVTVRAFYDSMVGCIAEEAQITLKTLLDELEEARQAALCQEKPQAAAMVAASMGKAKLLGLEAPAKVDHSSSDGSMSPKATVSVAELTDEQLAAIIGQSSS